MIKKSKINFINVKIETGVPPGPNKSMIKASGKFLNTGQVGESKVNLRISIRSKDRNASANRIDVTSLAFGSQVKKFLIGQKDRNFK